MASQYTVAQILNIAQLAQEIARNDFSLKKVLKGESLDDDLGTKIFLERSIIQYRYNQNPSDSSLQGTANYLKSLCGNYFILADNIINGTSGAAPIVNGPSNQTVNLGSQATFTITVASTLLYSVKWFKQGVEVPGQTGLSYTFTPDQSDNGDQIYAVVTNAVGSTTSSTATLTVNVSLTASYYYGDTDYYSDLSSGTDNITYNGTVSLTNGQPITIPFPSGASNNKFNVVRYPVSQGIKTLWFNGNLNQGQIPDSVYRDILTIGSFYYIVSRNAMSLDPLQPVIYS